MRRGVLVKRDIEIRRTDRLCEEPEFVEFAAVQINRAVALASQLERSYPNGRGSLPFDEVDVPCRSPVLKGKTVPTVCIGKVPPKAFSGRNDKSACPLIFVITVP